MSVTTPVNDYDLNEIARFYNDYYRDEVLDFVRHYPKERDTFYVDYDDLQKRFTGLAEHFREDPEAVTSLLEDGLTTYDIPVDVDMSHASVRVKNLPDYERKYVGSYLPEEVVNRLEPIAGQVSKVSQKQLRDIETAFRCHRCDTIHRVPQIEDDDTLAEPHECEGCERKGPFYIDDKLTESNDFQRVRLQVPPEEARGTSKEKIDVTLSGDDVGAVTAGDRVVANMMVSSRYDKRGQSRLATKKLVGEAHSVEPMQTDYDDIEIAPHREVIEDVANSENPVEHIVASILPSHHGDELIKEAIAYQLFGGVRKELPDGSVIRGNSHILLVGDPGTGKTTLLDYATRLVPRGVNATGTASTAAGLTVAAVQDDFGGDGWTLEAGALVEAHKGVCAIDELDDMAEDDRAGLLEAMSNQRISVAKAGINATLPAETAVLAAANPKYGRFEVYESIVEQFDLSAALLNRFDLIFTVADRADEEKDREIVRSQNQSARIGQKLARGDTLDDDESKAQPMIEEDAMRAYIALARQKVPVLTDEAADLIEQEYIAFRQANDDDGAVATNPRFNEAIQRLAEASARMRLSETVDREDVARVLRIHRKCMEDIGVDPESGDFDVDIIESGQAKSQRDRIRNIKGIITDLCGQDGYAKGAPIDEVVEIAQQAGIDADKAEHAIEKLKREGHAYEPSTGHIRLSVNYN